MRKLKAFTLSEIMIALLVLGIIVAASVPTILKLTPNKNAIMMKKAYYTTETIIHDLINDATYYPDRTSEGVYGFEDNTVATNLKVPGTDIVVNSGRKLPCLFASKLNIKDDLANVCKTADYIDIVNTMDGMTWNLSELATTGSEVNLYIDVDGINNGVSAFNGSSLKACTAGTFVPTNCTGTLTKRQQNRFDRIAITITRDGRLKIENQTAFADIIDGTTKLIGGDDDGDDDE